MNWNAPTTLEDLRQRIEEADWFTSLGTCPEAENIFVISTLQELRVSPEAWDWLPTDNGMSDPVHMPSLADIAKQQGVYSDYLRLTTEYYKLTLVSLRKMDENNPLFRVGPVNNAPAARGGALYALRMAVGEIVLGRQGFWCSLLSYYFNGCRPCGLTESRKLVIF